MRLFRDVKTGKVYEAKNRKELKKLTNLHQRYIVNFIEDYTYVLQHLKHII